MQYSYRLSLTTSPPRLHFLPRFQYPPFPISAFVHTTTILLCTTTTVYEDDLPPMPDESIDHQSTSPLFWPRPLCSPNAVLALNVGLRTVGCVVGTTTLCSMQATTRKHWQINHLRLCVKARLSGPNPSCGIKTTCWCRSSSIRLSKGVSSFSKKSFWLLSSPLELLTGAGVVESFLPAYDQERKAVKYLVELPPSLNGSNEAQLKWKRA